MGAVVGVLTCGFGTAAYAAAPDNDVEWSGASHLSWSDLRPLCPVDGEAFTVRFQAYRNDLTSARVHVFAGGTSSVHEATLEGQRGVYDVWAADLPPTTDETSLRYVLELTDGSDTDYYDAAGMTESLNPDAGFLIDFQTLSHAPVGTTPVTGGTVFRVWAPDVASAWVRGEFNDWSLENPMTRLGNDFVAFVPGAEVGQAFKFYFPGGVWKADARARDLRPTDSYNAGIVDPLAYEWRSDSFVTPPVEEMVVYQLHVGTFAGRNDPYGWAPNPSRYRDVADRVEHLVELGVNAVYLNPVHEFPGPFSGGYNPVTGWALESSLGTVDDFKHMVDELHANGIAVLLDIVWNHLGPTDNFLWDYTGSNIYFGNPVVDTPWGPQPDVGRAEVRDYFLDSVELLLGEYRLDGLRVDAVSTLTSGARWQGGQALMRGLNTIVDRRHAGKPVIAEAYGDDPWYLNPVPSGLGFDAQYHQGLRDALRGAVFDAAFGDPNVTSIISAIDGSGATAGTAAFNYFELHDEAWPMNGHERAVRVIDPVAPHDDQYATGRTKLAHGLVLLAKGIPAILQGTEWLEDDGWEVSKIDWSHKEQYAGVFAYYRDLIHLRTDKPALFATSDARGLIADDIGNVLAFERTGPDGRSYVVVGNFSETDYTDYRLPLPRSGQWGVIVNSEASQYGGSGFGASGAFQSEPIAYVGQAQSAALAIPARSLMLLQHDPEFIEEPCTGDFDGSGSVNVSDLLAYLSAFRSGAPEANLNGDASVNVTDLLAFLAAFREGC